MDFQIRSEIFWWHNICFKKIISRRYGILTEILTDISMDPWQTWGHSNRHVQTHSSCFKWTVVVVNASGAIHEYNYILNEENRRDRRPVCKASNLFYVLLRWFFEIVITPGWHDIPIGRREIKVESGENRKLPIFRKYALDVCRVLGTLEFTCPSQ